MRARKRRAHAARPVARRRRQHRLGRARRAGAAGGAEPARDPRARGAAAGLRRLRRGLPRDRAVPRVPRPAQGAARRPGRRPHRRVAADRPRGRRHRPRAAAAHAVDLPARGRADPCRARDAAGLDGQRRPAGGGRAVGRAGAAVHPPGLGAGLQPPRRRRWCWPSVACCRVVAYRVMVRIGRLPEESGCCDDAREPRVGVRRVGCIPGGPGRARHSARSSRSGSCSWSPACRPAGARVSTSAWRRTCATRRGRPGCSSRPDAGAAGAGCSCCVRCCATSAAGSSGCSAVRPRSAAGCSVPGCRRTSRGSGPSRSSGARRRSGRLGRRPRCCGSAVAARCCRWCCSWCCAPGAASWPATCG